MNNYLLKSTAFFTLAILASAPDAFAGTFRRWSFSIPSSSTGNFSSSESTVGATVNGSFNRVGGNSFLKMTITEASGTDAPPAGTVRYGLEAPGFSLFVQPTLQTENRLINTAITGVCPTAPWTGNFVITYWPSAGFDLNGNVAAFGKFTWNPATNTMNLDNIYKLGNFTQLAANIPLGGTCSNGVITLSGTGDRGGTVQISSGGGSIYTVDTATNGKVMFATPTAALPSAAILNGEYSAYIFNHATAPELHSYRGSFTSATNALSFGVMNDIDSNNADWNNGWRFTSVQVNTPQPGMITGRIERRVSGSYQTVPTNVNNEVVCISYLTQKTFLVCLTHDLGTDLSKPRSFVLVGDNQPNAPGTLDTYSFGTLGKVLTPVGTTFGGTNAMVLQSDRKIVSVGYTLNGANGYDHALVRLEQSGALDTSFGGSGIVVNNISPLPGGEDRGMSLAVQGDGKIVVGGYSMNSLGNYDPSVVRYNPNGTLDATFHGDGINVQAMSAFNETGNAIALQGDGKIILGGQAKVVTGGADLMIQRYTSNGYLDASFGNAGTSRQGMLAGTQSMVHSVAVQPDGKIVGAGIATPSMFASFTVMRLNSNGTQDVGFDGDGFVYVNFGGGMILGQANAVSIRPSGKILVAGTANPPAANAQFAIVQLNSNGTFDTSFGGGDGIVLQDFNTDPNGHEACNAMAIQGDGKIVVAGNYYATSMTKYLVARFSPTGVVDTTFDVDGKVTMNVSDNYEYGKSVAIQSDGKIVVAGASNDLSGFDDFAVFRLWGN